MFGVECSIIIFVILDVIQGIGQNILSVFFVVWWVVIPLGLFFIFWQFWLFYVLICYLRNQKWVVLEIKIPQNIEKTPKAMEQIFAAIYQIYSFGIKIMEKYWDGKLAEDFISFELVGQAGGVHFYTRMPAKYRNIVESAIYAQYPDAEIHEAEDYINFWPATLPNEIYDIAGSDYQLIREGAYPIQTYYYFEEIQKEKRLDPIAAITEVMSRLKNDEALWLQIFIRPPADNSWRDEAKAVIDKILERKKPTLARGFFGGIVYFIKNLVVAPLLYPIWPGKEKPKDQINKLLFLTPGERKIIEAIENKMSKINFVTNIRFVYIDRRDSFSPLNVAAMMSTFNQFNTQTMNGFMPKVRTLTLSPAGYGGLYGFLAVNIKRLKARILWYRKRRLWDNYKRLRWSRGKGPLLSTEELATLYHFPTMFVESPLLRRVGAKKGEPPAGLPIE